MTKSVKTHIGEKARVNKWCWGKNGSLCVEKKLQLFLSLHRGKMTSWSIKDLMKYLVKLLEKITAEMLQDTGTGKGFLSRRQSGSQANVRPRRVIQLKSSQLAKETRKEVVYRVASNSVLTAQLMEYWHIERI